MKKVKSIIKSTNEVTNVQQAINEKVTAAVQTIVEDLSKEYHRGIQVGITITTE